MRNTFNAQVFSCHLYFHTPSKQNKIIVNFLDKYKYGLICWKRNDPTLRALSYITVTRALRGLVEVKCHVQLGADSWTVVLIFFFFFFL